METKTICGVKCRYGARTENPNERDESSAETVTNSEAIDLLKQLKANGLDVDFEEEDADHISAMEGDELIGYLFDSLLNAGVEDPEETLRAKGILQ